jgi:general secretion pathway protein D
MTMKRNLIFLLPVLLLSACQPFSNQTKPQAAAEDINQGKIFQPKTIADRTDQVDSVNEVESGRKNRKPSIYEGTGKFVNQSAVKNKKSKELEGEASLNFENADIAEVVGTVFDILEKKYSIDAAVSGTVTIKAGTIPLKAMLPTVEAVLRMHDIVIVNDGSIYKVMPIASAKKGIRLPVTTGSGYRAQVFTLDYIAASEMAKIISTTAPDVGSVVVDDARNFLVVSGTSPELTQIADSVKIFDVDWLAGMSVAVFPVENADAKAIADELNNIIGKDKNPNAAMIKVVPIERLNSLLVITPQPSYLSQIGTWVKRLDKPGNQAGQRLYVYYVQNGKAAELADILDQVVGGKVEVSKKPALPTTFDPAAPASAQSGIAISDNSEIKVIADEVNNALLIMADPAGYRLVRDALTKLDITPLQVLIEVTIAEVVLKDNLKYGVEWFFKNNLGSKNGSGTLDLGLAGLGNAFTGFQYKIADVGGVRAVVEALDDQTDVNILSSPSVMVLNNQSAQIEVGDEVPILTQQSTATSTAADNPVVVNSVEYKQTGILLKVTPRVNINGLVTLEIVQEVSDVVNTNSSTIDSPTITQRKIETLVAVNSEETVILGGLISEKNEELEAGVPVLKDIPYMGALFGQTTNNTERSELMIMITPHVIKGEENARQVTDEFRRKMKGLSVFDI